MATVHFLLQSKTTTQFNIAYTLKCDSKLISLSQLYKSEISYHNLPNCMIFKQKRNTIEITRRYKNLFMLKAGLKDKAMLVQGRGRPIYLLSSNLQIRLWHYYLDYASNIRVIQAFKLVDRINLEKAIGPNNELYSSDSKPNNKNNKFDKDTNSKSTTINKTIEYNLNGVKKLCKAYIESEYTRIVKSKKITPITKRL